MKKTFLAILIASLALVTISSCKKTVKALFPGAETPLPELIYTFPATGTIVPLHTPFTIPVVQPFNLDSIVRANTGNNFGAGDITSVKLKELDLKIVSGYDSLNNLSNIEYVSFVFSSSSNSTKIPVANVSFDSTYSISKVVPGQGTPELRPYLDGKELYYDVTLSIRKYTTKNLKLSVIAIMTMK